MEANNVEIARSYSRKVNIGNYESLDIFASAKREVPWADRDKISAELFAFCVETVGADIQAWKDAREARKNGTYTEPEPYFKDESEKAAIDNEIHRNDDLPGTYQP